MNFQMKCLFLSDFTFCIRCFAGLWWFVHFLLKRLHFNVMFSDCLDCSMFSICLTLFCLDNHSAMFPFCLWRLRRVLDINRRLLYTTYLIKCIWRVSNVTVIWSIGLENVWKANNSNVFENNKTKKIRKTEIGYGYIWPWIMTLILLN
jgi:hypothetical protein